MLSENWSGRTFEGVGRSWASRLRWRRCVPDVHPVRRDEGLVGRPFDVGGHDSLLVFASAVGVGAWVEAGVAPVRADRPAAGPLRCAAAVGGCRVLGAGLCRGPVAGVHPHQLHGAGPEDVGSSATIDYYADPDFWGSDDDPDDAVYVHKMAVDRGYAGRGLGGQLLDLAGALAEDAGRSWVRLDAWRTNPRLQRYYQEQGFTRLRVVDLAHRQSGALFQRPAHVRASRVSLAWCAGIPAAVSGSGLGSVESRREDRPMAEHVTLDVAPEVRRAAEEAGMEPTAWIRRAIRRELDRAAVTRDREAVEAGEPVGYLIPASSSEQMREEAEEFLTGLESSGGPISA